MRRMHRHIVILVFVSLFLYGFSSYVTLKATQMGLDVADPFPGTGSWAESQRTGMTLEQKVSQLFVTSSDARFMNVEDPAYRGLVDLVERFEIGGVMFSRGDPLSQVALVNDIQRRSRVPLLISQDMEWGAGMRVDRATTFPRTMALGASRNPDLAYALGVATAAEARALGVHQVYAPVADVNNNPDNPVINTRSFGERPELVSEMVRSHVQGLQDGGVIATAKHFPGHGDTTVDSHLDLPVLPFARSRLDQLELVPFRTAIEHGVMSIMTGHLALPALQADSLTPASLSHKISTELLREALGFDGLVVTDAMNMQGVTARYGTGEAAVRAIEAGADLVLMTSDEYGARTAVLQAVASGRLSERRIDESVLRVLRAKEWLRLNASAQVDPQRVRDVVDAPAHKMLSLEIGRRGLTLLRNEGDLIPILGPRTRILTIVLSSGPDATAGAGFVRTLQSELPRPRIDRLLLDARSEKEAFDAALAAAEEAEVVIVASYLQARSGAGRMSLTPLQNAFVSALLGQEAPVAFVSFGNPYLIMEIDPPAAYLTTYGAGDASETAAAQAIAGSAPIRGRIPVTVPGRHAFGDGIDTRQERVRHGYAEEVGLSTARLQRIDSLVHAAIEDRAFPAAAAAVGRAGVVALIRGYGHYTYASDEAVDAHTLFDIASLTKVVATTTAIMKLYEEELVDLDAPVARYVPAFGVSGKESVTVRQLLTHSAGLPSFTPFHTLGMTRRQQVLDSILTQPPVYVPGSDTRYSDHGFVVLSLIVEAVTGRRFDAYVHDEILAPLEMYQSGFRPPEPAPQAPIAPTEIDRVFRGRLLRGEVHDETAWILGGVSGNAGLFSTADNLARFVFMLMNHGRVNGREFLREETIRMFTTRANATSGSTRALGWDTRSPIGYSSAGQLLGPRSYGHTGYTGTSLWIDPDQQLFVLLLTNRVHPTRDNNKIAAVRASIADAAYEAILGPPEPFYIRNPRDVEAR